MAELWRLGASELARLVRSREASCREAVESCLARIEAVNPAVNAVTAVLTDQALSQADASDRALDRGEAVGPLCGVPFTVKEDVDVAGSATTHGVAALKGAVAHADAPHVAALRAAGAIPVGRTNMPEFGMRWHTANALHGPTRNPWDPRLTPGGSSGGEAAAVASGMSPLGLGGDGAGSLRWPALCCGVAALKPSFGRVPVVSAGPLPFGFQLLAVFGPMARRIEDLRLALEPMCRASSGSDPWHVTAPVEGPAHPGPIRVAVMRDPGGFGVEPAVGAAVDRAAEGLAAAGYELETREAPQLARTAEIYFQIMGRFGRLSEDAATPPPGFLSAEFERFWADFNGPWERAAGRICADPMMERAALYRAWSALLAETPLILAPIAARSAWPVGADLEPGFGEAWLRDLSCTVVPNLLGLPSVAVPTGPVNGVPHAVQIIGPRYREDLCLDAAQAIEAAIPPSTPIDPAMAG
ncbi:amidase [Phenylobacterium sp.]|uniref:amidase n=1 Tax=Phenylobacterium sp. TaxID=1871053 RepID=UPI002B55F5AC|nr:amidase [Phenylobacterium sp.]HVI30715.1 amidase [Phenylobacterium sp.]